MPTRLDSAQVAAHIDALVAQIAAAFPATQQLNIVGIRTGGEILAQRIEAALRSRGYTHLAHGILDITLYRDDLSEIGPRPLVRPSQIDCNLDGTPLLLVDDVLFTGRSVRAALDQLADFGRPSAIRLAVLIDRGGRELPIHPDFVALKLHDIPPTQKVNLRLKETDGSDELTVDERPGGSATRSQ